MIPTIIVTHTVKKCFYFLYITSPLFDWLFTQQLWLQFKYWRDTKLIDSADLWNICIFLTTLENQRKFSAFFPWCVPFKAVTLLHKLLWKHTQTVTRKCSWALAWTSLVSASLALRSVFDSRHTLSSFCSLSTFFCNFLMVALPSSLSTADAKCTCFSSSSWATFCRRRFTCSSLLSSLSFWVFSWFNTNRDFFFNNHWIVSKYKWITQIMLIFIYTSIRLICKPSDFPDCIFQSLFFQELIW